MENIKAISLSNLVVNTRDYKKESDWILDKVHHCYYGLPKSERTDDIKIDLARYYFRVNENPDYYAGCVIMPELQEMDICGAAEYLRDWCNENQIPYVEAFLPYKFRSGIIKRSDFWKADPKSKEYDYDGLSEETVARLRDLLKSGMNDVNSIGRIKNFTANTFFRACKSGYISIGKECEKLSLSELYIRYSDGRDEGLTGTGHGLNEGPGIDFDSPSAWDEWYFDRRRGGGHPWEVIPG